MILDVGQNCDLKPTHRNHIQNRIKTISKSYEKRIKILSKSYQNHIKNISKPHKPSKKKPVPGLLLFFEALSLETYQKRIKTISKSYQKRIEIVSTSYQNHVKKISKTYQNHKNPRKIDQKPVPGLFLFLFLKPTRQEP